MRAAVSRAIRLALLPALVAMPGPGCEQPGGAILQIATDLPTAETDALAAALAAQADAGATLPRISWLRAAPGINATQLVAEGADVDIVLGGSPAGLSRLAAAGRLEPIGSEGGPPWRLLRPTEVGLLANLEILDTRALAPPTGWDALDDPRLAGLVALDDPRFDPVTAALAEARLAAGEWAEGYAALVRSASRAAPFGRVGGAAAARLLRDGAGLAPGTEATLPVGDRFRLVALGPGPARGLALVRGGPAGDEARSFVQSLEARGILITPDAAEGRETALRAVLLGATLVDAQDELVAARRLLDQGPSSRLESYLTEAPPWPPASVQELIRSDPSGALVEALAAQVAPDLEARVWLLSSWDAAPRPIDVRRLSELASAAGGSVAAEPRFLAWLGAEWATWARQRYRRVARQARADRSESTRTPPAEGAEP